MGNLIYGFITWMLGNAAARVLTGAGLGLISFSILDGIINTFLDNAVSSLSGLPQLTIALLGLAGVGTGISIVGGALLTAAAIKSASLAVGIKK